MEIDSIREWCIRFLPVFEQLDKGTGYGLYLVQMHGKRPVKLYRVNKPTAIDATDATDDCVELFNDA